MIAQYFIVNGQPEKFLLEQVLPEEIVSHSRFILGNGYNTAISKARSLLISSELPVSLVVDSETTDTASIAEKHEFMTQSLRQLSTSEHFHIFLAIPELEILFFHKKDRFETLIRDTLSEQQWEMAHYKPKAVLQNIFQTSNLQKTLQHWLTPEMIDYLRETELIQHIIKSCRVMASDENPQSYEQEDG